MIKHFVVAIRRFKCRIDSYEIFAVQNSEGHFTYFVMIYEKYYVGIRKNLFNKIVAICNLLWIVVLKGSKIFFLSAFHTFIICCISRTPSSCFLRSVESFLIFLYSNVEFHFCLIFRSSFGCQCNRSVFFLSRWLSTSKKTRVGSKAPCTASLPSCVMFLLLAMKGDFRCKAQKTKKRSHQLPLTWWLTTFHSFCLYLNLTRKKQGNARDRQRVNCNDDFQPTPSET